MLAFGAGHAAKRAVVTGTANDAQTIVTSGLHVGDRVIVERNVGIVDGVAVAPTGVPSAQPSAKP